MDDGTPHDRKPRIKFANAVAMLALFIALAGTSVGAPVREAAGGLAKSVGRALHLSKHADATARKALTAARHAEHTALDRAGVTGPAGPQGPQGPAGATGATGRPGAPGSAIGYATIEYCPGNCLDQQAVGWFTPDDDAFAIDNQANFNHGGTGIFCFQQLPFHAHNLVANLGPSTGSAATNEYTVQTLVGTSDKPITEAACSPSGAADQNAVVYVRKADGTLGDPDLSAKLYALFN
jgi:hypothetical protein